MFDEKIFSPFYSSFLFLCSQKGVSPSVAARDAGISSGAPTAWKKGAVPKPAQRKKLCTYFGVTDEVLLGYTKKEKAPTPDGERTIGDRIRTIRLSKGLTQREVSFRCKIAEHTLRKYESGQSSPKSEDVEKIASALEVPVSALKGYVFTGRVDGKDIYELSQDVIDVVIDEKKPIPKDGGGPSDKDMRLIEWFRSLPPEKRKAILMLGEAPEGLDE